MCFVLVNTAVIHLFIDFFKFLFIPRFMLLLTFLLHYLNGQPVTWQKFLLVLKFSRLFLLQTLPWFYSSFVLFFFKYDSGGLKCWFEQFFCQINGWLGGGMDLCNFLLHHYQWHHSYFSETGNSPHKGIPPAEYPTLLKT